MAIGYIRLVCICLRLLQSTGDSSADTRAGPSTIRIKEDRPSQQALAGVGIKNWDIQMRMAVVSAMTEENEREGEI
jgi:hypothetical protein